jgi:ACR3 family arsenite efflux pump ArsB
MDSALLEPLVVILTTVVTPLGVGILAGVLVRKDPRQGIWSEYFLGAVLIGLLVLVSPSLWISLLSDSDRENRVILSNGYLIFGPWLGAFLTITVGIVSGMFGAERHGQRRRELAAAENSP